MFLSGLLSRDVLLAGPFAPQPVPGMRRPTSLGFLRSHAANASQAPSPTGPGPPPHNPNPLPPFPKQFVIKTTIAATMFPHLSQRLFVGRSVSVVKTGLAIMGFTFFVVQLSSMITGWCAAG